MHDNKIRLSRDVIEKAEQIAAEWGLKNARAAVEAVFRRYSDEYLYGRKSAPLAASFPGAGQSQFPHSPSECEALNELDDLLAM